MGTPTLSTHPLGTHAKLGETDDSQLHYPKGFIRADDNTMLVKGDNSELAYTGAIYTEKIRVTSAELLSISTTPKTIISKSVSGGTIRIIGIITHLNFGTTGYSASDPLSLQFETSGVVIGEISTSAITGIKNRWETGLSTKEYIELSENENVILTSVSNPIDGDGTLDIYITFQRLV